MNSDASELIAALRSTTEPGTWRRAAAEVGRFPEAFTPYVRRTVRVRVLATWSSDLLVRLLPAAGVAAGIGLEVTQAPYGQVEQELLDATSATHREPPDYVLLVPSADDLALGTLGEQDPEEVVVGRRPALVTAVGRRAKRPDQGVPAPVHAAGNRPVRRRRAPVPRQPVGDRGSGQRPAAGQR